MILRSFNNNIVFQKARDNSFMEFMNEQSYSATYMAQYLDHQMRSGLKGKSDGDVEASLSTIIRLFCCLHSRDFFLKEYEIGAAIAEQIIPFQRV